ncbi:MAG: class IV adenylate cyclase [Ignisphaera sp.]
MKEFEIKVPVDDLEYVEKNLRKLGAIFIGFYEEHDYYVDMRPCIDLMLVDSALRIRLSKDLVKGGITSELTFKGPKERHEFAKIRKEVTVTIDSGKKMLDIFKSLGFNVTAVVLKRRKIFRYNNYRIYLDDVESLGKFVEIEFVSENENVSGVEEVFTDLVNILDLPKIFISKSYLELLLEKNLQISTSKS